MAKEMRERERMWSDRPRGLAPFTPFSDEQTRQELISAAPFWLISGIGFNRKTFDPVLLAFKPSPAYLALSTLLLALVCLCTASLPFTLT